jgi:hypothetical protein
VEDPPRLAVDCAIRSQDAHFLATLDIDRRVRMEGARQRRERLGDHGRSQPAGGRVRGSKGRSGGSQCDDSPAHLAMIVWLCSCAE